MGERMALIIPASAIVVFVLLIVCAASGAAYVLSDILRVLVSGWPVVLVVLVAISAIMNIWAVYEMVSDESDGEDTSTPWEIIQMTAWAAINTTADTLVALGFLTVALTEMQMMINSSESNLIGYAILLIAIGWVEVLIVFLLASGAALALLTFLIEYPMIKLIAAVIYLLICILWASGAYPNAFADVFQSTPIGAIELMISDASAQLTGWRN